MKRGKPPSPEAIEAIAGAVRQGMAINDCAPFADVCGNTLRTWIRKGTEERAKIGSGHRPRKTFGSYLDLLKAVEKACAEFQHISLTRIGNAADEGAWQADAWKLERRHPEKWGRQRLDIQAEGKLIVEGVGWLNRKIELGTSDGD